MTARPIRNVRTAARLRLAAVLLVLGALFAGAVPAAAAAPYTRGATATTIAVPDAPAAARQFAAPRAGEQLALKLKKKRKKKGWFGTVALLLVIIVVLLLIVLFARNRGRRSRNGD